MDKQTVDAFQRRRWEAYDAWYAADGPIEKQLWEEYTEAKRMHELAQDTYVAAQRQEQDHGHRNS